MKRISTLIFCTFFIVCLGHAITTPGYIITKDAKIITGKVADIFYSNWGSELVFINEMGRRYKFHPALIHGFALKKGEEISKFESKFQKGTWRFLKIVEKGKGISLYRSPSVKTQESIEVYGESKVVSRRVKEFWIETVNHRLIRIHSLNYKKKLKYCLNLQPDLVKKLGKEGYRFKNLATIVQEFNELMEKKTKKM